MKTYLISYYTIDEHSSEKTTLVNAQFGYIRDVVNDLNTKYENKNFKLPTRVARFNQLLVDIKSFDNKGTQEKLMSSFDSLITSLTDEIETKTFS